MQYALLLHVLFTNSYLFCPDPAVISDQPKRNDLLMPIGVGVAGLICVACAPECGSCCTGCTIAEACSGAAMGATGTGLFCCAFACLLANATNNQNR
ncbi:MAG: hypothetical protein EBU90_11285 [Proteobacteria bacterium]|nr:hypothetical protein [Pseudomonadota bacterium]NBP14806.1 hypothetical protein [bacterium]